jgi:hypothetical protein
MKLLTTLLLTPTLTRPKAPYNHADAFEAQTQLDMFRRSVSILVFSHVLSYPEEVKHLVVLDS